MNLYRLMPSCLLVLGLAGCGGDPAILSATANPTTVAAGGTITMTVELENFELGEAAESGLTARGLRASHGEAEGGHIHTYLDNTETNPLAQTTSTTFALVIPGATIAGPHSLIVRLHGADHLTLTPEVKTTVAITVQ